MDINKLSNVNGTEQWRTLREEYLDEVLDDLRDVTKPLLIGEIEVTGIDAYNAKRVIVKLLEKMIWLVEKKEYKKIETKKYN